MTQSHKVAILQSNYIPWKGYFDLIDSVDDFVIYDEVQYTRRDWRNRNKSSCLEDRPGSLSRSRLSTSLSKKSQPQRSRRLTGLVSTGLVSVMLMLEPNTLSFTAMFLKCFMIKRSPWNT
jgi:hypothetical protein